MGHNARILPCLHLTRSDATGRQAPRIELQLRIV
jgi:hypothetical protein